jgi:hypothetical protein
MLYLIWQCYFCSNSSSASNSPYQQSSSSGSSNPFSKKSSVSAAMAALNQQGPPASSPSSDNPYAKGAGGRASTAGASVQNPPRVSHSAPAARRGSGSSQGSEDDNAREGPHSARRAESGGVAAPAPGGGSGRTKISPRVSGHGRYNSPREASAEETEYTPRSNHSGGPVKPMRSSSSTSALPPTHSSRPKSHTRNQPNGSSDLDTSATTALHSNSPGAGPKWKCLNNKCGKWNEADDGFCAHCAFRRGATGERGALARSADEFEVDGASVEDDKWKCKNSRCGKMNSNDDDFCMHCATRKGATGARGTGAVLFAAER